MKYIVLTTTTLLPLALHAQDAIYLTAVVMNTPITGQGRTIKINRLLKYCLGSVKFRSFHEVHDIT